MHLRSYTLTIIVCLLCTVQNAQTQSGEDSVSSLDSTSFLGNTSTIEKDFGKLPTTITAESLTLRTLERTFRYDGNVRVTQGAMQLTSKKIEGNYTEDNQITSIKASGDVVIAKEDMEASSQEALYDATASIVVLTKNPQLKQGDSILTADSITIYLTENRSAAEGNVRVTFIKQPTSEEKNANQITPTPTPLPEVTKTAKKQATKTKGQKKNADPSQESKRQRKNRHTTHKE
jgi:lipopolysaccharide export system protein LptA